MSAHERTALGRSRAEKVYKERAYKVNIHYISYGVMLHTFYYYYTWFCLFCVVKMLSIANPNNGAGFFSLLYNYNWVREKDMVGLTKDKVHSICTAKITAERYLNISVNMSFIYMC